MLAATGGRPIETLQWAASDIDADAWLGIPNRVAQGRVESFVDWPLGRLIETLQKLCHDWICASIDAPPRYFPRQCLGDPCDVSRLLAWSAQLRNHARHAEHPWQVSLKIDALIQQGHSAFVAPMVNETAQVRGLSGHASLHFTA
jgi:DNA polymerase-3 subunit delta'